MHRCGTVIQLNVKIYVTNLFNNPVLCLLLVSSVMQKLSLELKCIETYERSVILYKCLFVSNIIAYKGDPCEKDVLTGLADLIG
jgi:hypothetical protein